MAPAVAIGGEVCGDTMARRGGEEKSTRIARTTSVMEAGVDKLTKFARTTSGVEGGAEKLTKIARTTSVMEGGIDKLTKFARTTSGVEGGAEKLTKIARTTSAMENGVDKPTKIARTTSGVEGGADKPGKIVRTISGMEGGEGEFSYTRNSSVQSQSLSILTPILEQEIKELEVFKDWSGGAIRVADFGCSVGVNTLGYAEICYRNVCQARVSNGGKIADEVQYFFCDLPNNDFNTLFLQVEDWRKKQTSMEDFLFSAVSGSFHRRLLPKGSLHVAISTLAVHWMSQVPDAVLDKSSPAYNKGRVWIDDNKNVATLQAFQQTARQDLRKFLVSRAEEVVPGGLVLVYAMGCPDARHPELQWAREGEYAGPYSKVFEATWEELVLEGVIEEERRDTFNVPIYSYSVEDMKEVAESTNSFHIKRCEIKRQNYFAQSEVERLLSDPKAYGKFTKNFTKSILNTIMVEHLGKEKCRTFFERLERNATTAAEEKRVTSLPIDCVMAVLIRK